MVYEEYDFAFLMKVPTGKGSEVAVSFAGGLWFQRDSAIKKRGHYGKE
jgi:hypothetical protein